MANRIEACLQISLIFQFAVVVYRVVCSDRWGGVSEVRVFDTKDSRTCGNEKRLNEERLMA